MPHGLLLLLLCAHGWCRSVVGEPRSSGGGCRSDVGSLAMAKVNDGLEHVSPGPRCGECGAEGRSRRDERVASRVGRRGPSSSSTFSSHVQLPGSQRPGGSREPSGSRRTAVEAPDLALGSAPALGVLGPPPPGRPAEEGLNGLEDAHVAKNIEPNQRFCSNEIS